ncbi:MAG: hypothetical protein ACREUT_05680 [Steroidobacteraceae bacterium]
MSELVLIASDLYRAASDIPHPDRAALLPSLSRIARYGAVEPLPAGWRAWLAAWLGRGDLASAPPASIAGVAPIASAAPAPGVGVRAPEKSVQPFLWLADPVHLIVGPTSVYLAPNGVLALDAGTQRALASAFDEQFAQSGYRLEPLRAGRFLLRGPAPAGELHTTESARILGASLAEALPRGRGASALRALGAEIEMWLHEHPLNAQRTRERRPPISTLWLWGGGPPLGADVRCASRESPSAAIFGDDAYMEGLARLCGARFAAAPADLAALAAADDAPRRSVALELLRFEESSLEAGPLAALERFERDWIAPALGRLAAGVLARLTILANDRRLSIGARDRFRLWRRPRAALAVLR